MSVEPTSEPIYTVAVRELCEFAAKQGDLDMRFTPSPSAEEGIAGHRTVAARRAEDRREGHRAELPVSGRFGPLRVRGRVDGFDVERGRVEEVKTHKGPLDRMPANHRALHWAQARVYAHLLCEQLSLPRLQVALVYFEIGSEQETPLVEDRSAAELRGFFDALCTRFLGWARQQLAHRATRDEALRQLAFPLPTFRPGQRALAENVWRAARSGRCLMAQAPTGIGKTLGTLFPLLKAVPAEGSAQGLDKIFFLSAKTAGRAVALDALAALREPTERPLRVLELVAREKACLHPQQQCHGASCPLAAGFYDRLPAARQALVDVGDLSRDAVQAQATSHRLCPYYLTQELARWADVVVGDYNHYFDSGGALLHGLTAVNGWRVAVLVDEAHNLVERARDMYSAPLASAALEAAARCAPAAVKPALRRVQRRWKALAAAQRAGYAALPAVPDDMLESLRNANAAISDHLAEQAHLTEAPDDPLLRFHFEALHFVRLAESFAASHSLFDIRRGEDLGSTLCIRNVVPAPFLKPRLSATCTTVLFSATLSPQAFYADALGLPAGTGWLEVEGSFRAEQLAVHVVDRIPTRYAQRAESLAPIAELIVAQYRQRPGHYLAFFSSFEYLGQVAREFGARHPDVPAWSQTPQMSEAEQRRFLERFQPGGRGIGFAVLGGAFAEGIDLPGDRLIGAFIATLGLPQLNPVNEQMKLILDAAFGRGFEYTYLYPGLRKVVQAAGRVIRTPTDEGCVYLIDPRFSRPAVRALLPAWWQPRRLPEVLHPAASPAGTASLGADVK